MDLADELTLAVVAIFIIVLISAWISGEISPINLEPYDPDKDEEKE